MEADVHPAPDAAAFDQLYQLARRHQRAILRGAYQEALDIAIELLFLAPKIPQETANLLSGEARRTDSVPPLSLGRQREKRRRRD